jgi:Rad3-related DNA helicase
LVFFPSYDLMQHVLNVWEEGLLKFEREIFLEAKGSGEFKKVFDRYIRKV